MLDFEPIPLTLELGDGCLCLKPWPAVDAEGLYAAVRESMDTVGRWQPWCHAGYGMDDATAWIEHCRMGFETGEHFSFAVCDAGSGDILGGVGLNQINRSHRNANLGYWTRQSRHGQGLAAEASTLLARFAFERLGLVRIEIVAEPDNRPSRRVAEKIGARFEAVARHRLWIHDEARDAAIYGLLPADLKQSF
jgi:RimJ/RimL family protein N-acetyltransferase